MAIKKKKFYRLRSDSLHTFNIKAWSAEGVSAWTDDILIKTSAILPIAWPVTAEMKAKPLFFTRCLRVTWTPLLGYPLRFSHYVLFRKDTTEGIPAPTSDELTASGEAIVDGTLEDNEHFLKETGKLPLYVDRVKFDSDDDTDNGVLEEHQYHYWVWGVDNNGQLSYSYLGPDNAEFGKPTQPVLIPASMSTEVHERNAWWCDVNVVWWCTDGAEGYWVQRKLKTRALWGLPVWVEHDPDGAYGGDVQKVTLENFLCNTDYEFRVKAVNVPVRLVSPYSEIGEYTTDKDPDPPDEIESVEAKRLRQNLIRRGEYIKLTWDWPTGALMQQQIDYYRIYRLEGTDAEATAYLATILAGTATPYTETKKFGGTHFVDDEIVELSAGRVEGTQSFFWNGEYGTHTANDLKTAYIDEDLNTEVGVLTTSAYIDGAIVWDGIYSLQCEVGSATLHWSTCDLNGDEGYISLRWYPIDVIHTQDWLRIFHAHSGGVKNRLLIDMRLGKLWVSHVGNDVEKEVEHTKVWSSGDRNKWHHIEVRWKKSDDTLDVKVDDGDWVSSTDPNPITSFVLDVKYFVLGLSAVNPGGDTEQRYDKLVVSPDLDYPEIPFNYYHYWVTAVDIDEQESTATMVESYDKVSFGPPDAPVPYKPLVNTDEGFNMVLVLGFKLFTVKMKWDSVDEATYYRVKIKIKSPNRDAGPWMYTARIPEARINKDEDDDRPFFVYPFPLRKDTEITWAVAAGNMAGETESDEIGPMAIIQDTEGPSKANTPVGECLGINTLFPPTPFRWMVVILKWKPNDNYEGVESYIIYEDDEEVGRIRHNKLKGGPIKGWMIYHHFDAAASTTRNGTHTYKVQAAGYEDDEFGEISEPVTVKWEPWWVL